MTLSLTQFKKQLAKHDLTKAQIEASIDTFMAQTDRDYDRADVSKDVYSYIDYLDAPNSCASQLRQHAGYAVAVNQEPATPKQISYLASLMDEVDEQVDWHLSPNQPLTKAKASKMIDGLE